MAIRETSDDGRPIVVAQPTARTPRPIRPSPRACGDKVAALLGDSRRQPPRIVIQ